MFGAEDLRNRLKKQPFIPMRVVTTSGKEYDIRHPNMILIGKRDVTIGIVLQDEDWQYEQVARVALVHITALEDLPSPTPTGSNGPQTI